MDATASLSKPALWCYREAAEILGLEPKHGYRLVSQLVEAHEIETHSVLGRGKGLAKGITRDGLEILARSLNRTLPES